MVLERAVAMRMIPGAKHSVLRAVTSLIISVVVLLTVTCLLKPASIFFRPPFALMAVVCAEIALISVTIPVALHLVVAAVAGVVIGMVVLIAITTFFEPFVIAI